MHHLSTMRVRYSIIASDSVRGIPEKFLRKLKKRHSDINLKEENKERHKISVLDLAFFPVVSRAGTDIDAALKQINHEKKFAILVMLHHTFDPDAVVSGSNKFANNEKVLIVDCLFYEEKGLLKSKTNDKAYSEAGRWLKSNKVELEKLRSKKSKTCTIL